MAVAILIWLPSFPFSATFLNYRERAIAQARVNRDHKPRSHGGMTGWQGVKAVLIDPSAWLLMLIYASCEPFVFGILRLTESRMFYSQCRGRHDLILHANGRTFELYLVNTIS